MNLPPQGRPRVLVVAIVCATTGAVASPLLATHAAPHPATPSMQTQLTTAAQPISKARNVIFINGDGMSAAQREAGRLSLAGLDGRLQMDQLPVNGTVTTGSRDPKTFVTDSAAAATAWATGEKTYNGAISVDLDGNPLPILGEQARAAGKATGLVTTAQVTDASPAAFFAQTPDRGRQDEIARQYLEDSKPSVILGGGEDWWYPEGSAGAFPDRPVEDPSEASKGTRGNLVAEAQRRGYSYVSTDEQLRTASGDKLLGLFANEEMFQQRSERDGAVYSPAVPLSTMTSKALSILSQDKQGFFLLVEEEGIDEFAHENNGEKVLYSMKQLEAAVAVARRYVTSHPDTLLVVTGDHECGGLTVEDNSTADESGDGISTEDGPFPIRGSNQTFTMDWSTSGHTDAPVPISAAGPGSLQLTGQHPNTYIHEVLAKALG
ncbi:MAG: alkaline phosphatase [Friedmanniella sp.]